jgi:hypothetical protein
VRTVFLEPEIESGFPDVVAVYWNVAAASCWLECRTELTMIDVRVVHFLAMTGRTPPGTLHTFFGRSVSGSLDRLHAAGMIRRVSGDWLSRSIDDIFAVRRLIAIEAKVTAWRCGLDQAFLNTWFASESYLLLPHLPQSEDLRKEADRYGVGVTVPDRPLAGSGVLPRRQRIPLSYASWLFNEWAWRAWRGHRPVEADQCRSIRRGSHNNSLRSAD